MAVPERNILSDAVAIIDSSGRITAHSHSLANLLELSDSLEGHYADVFSQRPDLVAWLETGLSPSQGQDERGQFETEECRLQLVSLTSPSGPTMLLWARPNLAVSEDQQLTPNKLARIRHDIKNQLGSIKLYSTFLRKRLSAEPELLEVVEKINSVVGVITQQVSEIRHGED